MNRYYTIKEYAKKIDKPDITVRDWIKRHKLKSIRVTQQLDTFVIEEINNKPAVIAMMNLKGGCGKTTLATHLAIMLSKMEYRVLLIDTDHQNQCRMFFPDKPYRYTLKNALERSAKIEECIYTQETSNSQLDMIYSDYGLALQIPKIKEDDILKNLIEQVSGNYDFIVIDTSPSFDIVSINVAKTATHIIIPVMPAALHVEGMGHYLEALQEVAKVDVERIIGIIPNIVNIKIAQQKSHIELLREEFDDRIYTNIIPLDNRLPRVNDYRLNVFDLMEKSKASQALKKFVWETLRRL